MRAEHAENVAGEILGRSDGGAGQAFRCRTSPVLPRRDGEHVIVTDSDGSQAWTEVEDFTRSGPEDRHFVWDSGSGIVRFGPRVRYPDGVVRQHGAIPHDGAQISVTGYRHGGGTRGNVGARTLTVMRSTVPYVRGAINLAPASGGVDAESIAEAKIRGPLTLRTGQRAVTAGDYERLTLESSTEVARARCLTAGRDNGAVRRAGRTAGARHPGQARARRLRHRRAADAARHRTFGLAPPRRDRRSRSARRSTRAFPPLRWCTSAPGGRRGWCVSVRSTRSPATSTRSPAARTATAGRSTPTSTRPS